MYSSSVPDQCTCCVCVRVRMINAFSIESRIEFTHIRTHSHVSLCCMQNLYLCIDAPLSIPFYFLLIINYQLQCIVSDTIFSFLSYVRMVYVPCRIWNEYSFSCCSVGVVVSSSSFFIKCKYCISLHRKIFFYFFFKKIEEFNHKN